MKNNDLALPDHILVIEDDRYLQLLLKETFAACKNVVTADNGKAGLAYVKKNRPGFVITDLSMPEMDGITFIDNFASTQDSASLDQSIVRRIFEQAL